MWNSFGMIIVGGSDGYNDQDSNFTKTIGKFSGSYWWLSSPGEAVELARFGHCIATDGDHRVFLWGGQIQTHSVPVGYGLLIDSEDLGNNEVEHSE